MSPSNRERIINDLPGDDLELLWDREGPTWALTARNQQIAPPGAWSYWMILAGRGWGKTRTGAEFIVSEIGHGRMNRIALIGRTAADIRDVMIEGPSGIVAVGERYRMQPHYEPSKRRVTFHNGSVCIAYSAEEPDRLRGPEHDGFWCDELAAWRTRKPGESKSSGRNRAIEAWDNLMFGFRRGSHPRGVITTTPRPVPLVKRLLADAETEITRGSTFDNRDNLSPVFIEQVQKYVGTRIGRQELEAEVLEDVEGALWTMAMIDNARVRDVPRYEPRDKGELGAPRLDRLVISIDPSVSYGEESDATGIAATARGLEGEYYVLRAEALRVSPSVWGRRAIELYVELEADAIVYERNQGGDMVKHTVEVAWNELARAGKVKGQTPRLVGVHASRGKQTRAEPVQALYEAGAVHHVTPVDPIGQMVNPLSELEDEMIVFPVAGDHDDLVDALVWGIHELAPEMSDTGSFYVL